MKKLLFLFFTFSSLLTYSQANISITTGNVQICNGTLFDSGGTTGLGYQNNESDTLVICPSTAGNGIILFFNNFALDTANTAIPPFNNMDNITIYDGDSTNATNLGTFTANQLQGTVVAATLANTSGCLTLVFNSNSTGTGSFSANISCAIPCLQPTASFASPTVAQNPQRLCDGDSITFDASASFAQPTLTIVDYIFDFGDGTIDTSQTPIVTHTFNNGPGEYLVQLYVVDNNGCVNINVEIITVWISTTPIFNIAVPDPILCLGESICLDGSSLTPVTYTPSPTSTLSGSAALPDNNMGLCFETPLNFNFFSPGQTLANINDLMDVCVNMEHTFMGDLRISIICPNGSSVIMHDQGGDGTNLGNPIQDDIPTNIGTGLNYCWSPTATNGTWVDNSTFGLTPNTITNNTGFQSLTPGTYESLTPFTPLVGCPLNGTWILRICDLISLDNGFVFDYTVNFAPSIYPSITTFTPSIGAGGDSTYWTSSGLASTFITSTTPDSNTICITPTDTGSFNYTFNAIDDFGCFYDTTITIIVEPGPQVNAGNDIFICGNTAVQLSAAVTPPGIYNYSWSPAAGLNNTSTNSPIANTSTTTDYVVEVWAPGQQVCGSFDTISVIVNPQTVSAGNDSILNPVCAGSNALNLFTYLGGNPDSTGSWFENGNPSSAIFDPQITPSGTYTYTYLVPDPSCPDSSTITVTINTDISVDAGNDTTICVGDIAQLNATGNPAGIYNYNWSPALGLSNASINNPTASIVNNTTYIVEMWESGQQACATFDTVNILLNPIIFAGKDTIVDSICSGSDAFDLFALLGPNAQTTGTWSNGILSSNNIFDPQIIAPGTYSFTYLINDPNCPDSATVQVTILPIGDLSCGCPLNSSVVTTNVICSYDCNGQVVVNDSLGFVAEYSLDGNIWQTGNGFPNLCPGNYQVYTQNTFYGPTCRDTVDFSIQAPAPVVITALSSTDETCFGACNGEINLTAPLAYFYSIDNNPFQDSTRFTNLCVGNYDITVRDSLNCFADTSISIGGPSEVIANFNVSTNITFVPFTELTFSNRSLGANSYVWNFIGLDSLFSTNITYKFPDQVDDYQVCLTATNSNGCSDIFCNWIIVKEELGIYIPNSFTPNNNRLNDTFKPVLIKDKVVEYTFLIYDRWGQLIFETNDPDVGWNGTDKDGSKIIQSGVYVYNLKVLDSDNIEHKKTGKIQLLK